MMMMMLIVVMDKKWYNVEGYYDDDNQDDGYSDYQDDDDDKTDDGRIEASELTTQSRYIQLPTNWFPLFSSTLLNALHSMLHFRYSS